MVIRSCWTDIAERLAGPVLTHLATRNLRQKMVVESSGAGRELYSHLEAVGRLLAGISPWLELKGEDSQRWAELAREGVDAITDLESADYGNFNECGQPLVDAAFLAQGLLRAPNILWEPLAPRVKDQVLTAFRATRHTLPGACNWLLFSAIVETALFRFGAKDWDCMRIDYALRQHDQWYKGDGFYGDGADFHADYYNSFVIHPMLIDVLRHVPLVQFRWDQLYERVMIRARRQAAVLERMISPEGTFPPLGRSLAYRGGTMHLLAQMALLRDLPEGLAPGQVRDALTAVIRRTMEAPHTFDEEGWLRIGLCGSQPKLGEHYISTGSLYLCATALLPLGLPAQDPFWSEPPTAWTALKVWQGEAIPIDSSLKD